jgi:hypothetical protein
VGRGVKVKRIFDSLPGPDRSAFGKFDKCPFARKSAVRDGRVCCISPGGVWHGEDILEDFRTACQGIWSVVGMVNRESQFGNLRTYRETGESG